MSILTHTEQSYMKRVWNVYEFIWSYKYRIVQYMWHIWLALYRALSCKNMHVHIGSCRKSVTFKSEKCHNHICKHIICFLYDCSVWVIFDKFFCCDWHCMDTVNYLFWRHQQDTVVHHLEWTIPGNDSYKITTSSVFTLSSYLEPKSYEQFNVTFWLFFSFHFCFSFTLFFSFQF